jgi:ATP citrate (pro-S)-lyase
LFFSDEAQEYIKIGTLNGLFVLGRSMGFIGALKFVKTKL